MKRAALLVTSLLLFGMFLGGCVSSHAPREAGPHLSPREREARLLLEMDRMKKQDKTRLSRLIKQAKKGGREFLMRQETESRLRSIELSQREHGLSPARTAAERTEHVSLENRPGDARLGADRDVARRGADGGGLRER